ncbi:hypothetical protein PTUN_a1400 [Pseudoalteromonas tunicata]|nr:hypothetical protein PTUN_a1400 [Pseudoalteromonas tunicata]
MFLFIASEIISKKSKSSKLCNLDGFCSIYLILNDFKLLP